MTDLKTFHSLSTTTQLFTCDATSMYTNIDTSYAIHIISEYINSNQHLLKTIGIHNDIFICALRMVMIHNVFCFGDTYWIQLSGTAMGASPAPMYATIYFAILEQQIIPLFPECVYYHRFIDDGVGIWNDFAGETSSQTSTCWPKFQMKFKSISKLDWTFSSHTRTIDFLDVNITLNDDGHVSTRIFEKALNLHLYLPPHSCHPPGVLKGIIRGMMLQFHRLSSSEKFAQSDVNQ